MDEEQETVADLSIAGLSAADETSAGRALGVASGARYHEVAVVGEGGLGTVLHAHDRFLGRDVALKRIRGQVRSGSPVEVHDRFLHEARITAKLDHPNIVPVHDAGVTDDGRMFYTMRLIRGRSLAELAAEVRTFEARLALLGPITAACHAIGYAHRHGVIHRDLKPANIMVGELGETQVVDWGLAQVIAERPVTSGFAGTYPYASPEVLRGEPHGIAADVWALGVTLHEVLSGAHRFPGSKSEIERRAGAVPLPRADWPDDCPPELITIGERAMSSAPGDRYADAHALALDLDAFRDGRRVAAHRYSRLELLRRFVVAWRWPIAATAALALGTIGALALTTHRTETQRSRAVAAEVATRQELERAEAALADALAARAMVSLEQGAIAEAELGAVSALEHGEHPDARGVLAATQLAPHPTRATRVSIPDCSRVIATSASSAVCVKRDGVDAWEIGDAGPRLRWARPLRFDQAVAIGEAWLVAWGAEHHVVVLAADTGEEHARVPLRASVAGVQRALTGDRVVLHDRGTVVAIGTDGEPHVTERACAGGSVDAAATSDTTTWLVCSGGQLGTLGERGFMPGRMTGFGTDVSSASALAVSESGHDVAIGNTAGDVAVLDVRGCMSPGCEGLPRQVPFPSTGSTIRQLGVLGGSTLVAIDDRGAAVQLRRDGIGELTRIPIDPSTPPLFLEAGEIVSGGAAFSHWQIDDAAVPSVLRHDRGIVSAAISSDRTVAAMLTDNGELVSWNARTGTPLRRTQVRDARTVTLSADGAHATVLDGAMTATTYAIASGDVVDVPPITVGATTDAVRASAHVVSLGGWELEIADVEISSVALAPERRYVAIGTSSGRIELWDPARRRLVARLHGHTQRVTWLVFDRDRLWSAALDGQMRAWSLAPIDAPVDAMGRAVRASWGSSP